MRTKLLMIPAALLLLAGCSSTPAAEPTPTPSENPNVAACEDFVTVYTETAQAQDDRDSETITVEELREIQAEAPSRYSEISLAAEGDVKDRLDGLVDFITEEGGVSQLNAFLDERAFDAYKVQLDRVGQACTAEGVDVSFTAG